MTIVYQGKDEETAAATVAAFLAERGVLGEGTVVEYRGEAYAPGAALDGVPLVEGAELNVFRLVAGG